MNRRDVVALLCAVPLAVMASGCGMFAKADPVQLTYYYLPG